MRTMPALNGAGDMFTARSSACVLVVTARCDILYDTQAMYMRRKCDIPWFEKSCDTLLRVKLQKWE